ncbi:MAG: RNA methyltransferase, partial [Clostridia bacterium]|nr:RNA methyltransferase [Clostridia bacterium]
MRELIKINDFSAPELDVYVRLTGAQLRSRLEPEKGIFIAESPTVIEVALESGCVPLSLLTDEKLVNTSAKSIIEKLPENVPIYTATSEILRSLTGFELTRGALSAMYRPKERSLG